MQIDRIQNYNNNYSSYSQKTLPKNVVFGSHLTIKDAGRCLSWKQRLQIRAISKQFGENVRILLGTRKYKSKCIDIAYGETTIATKRDALFIIMGNDSAKRIIIPNSDIKNMQKSNKKLTPKKAFGELIIKIFKAIAEQYKDLKSDDIPKSEIKKMKAEIADFTDLKCRYSDKPVKKKPKREEKAQIESSSTWDYEEVMNPPLGIGFAEIIAFWLGCR